MSTDGRESEWMDGNTTDSFYYDNQEDWESLINGQPMRIVSICVIGIVIVFGGFFNISAVVIILRHRLWRENEGYFHLLAILIGNITILTIVYFPHWVSLFRYSYHIAITSDFICKVWWFLFQAMFSTGCYVIAQLIGVYMRGHVTQRPGCGCCRWLAERYCTPLGAKVVVGVISASFALFNLWQLWSVELQSVIFRGREVKMCLGKVEWYRIFWIWDIVSLFITWYIPTLIVIPIVWVLTVLAHRRREQGFSFVQMTADDNMTGGDFDRTSLLVAASVFLLQSPIIAIHVASLAYYHKDYPKDLYLAYGISHLIFTTHLVVVPLLCLVTLNSMRQQVSSTVGIKCCPRITGGDSGREEGDFTNGILPLDPIQSASSIQMLVP